MLGIELIQNRMYKINGMLCYVISTIDVGKVPLNQNGKKSIATETMKEIYET